LIPAAPHGDFRQFRGDGRDDCPLNHFEQIPGKARRFCRRDGDL
jgi:hypothetical protein